jgi:O-antigen ligase
MGQNKIFAYLLSLWIAGIFLIGRWQPSRINIELFSSYDIRIILLGPLVLLAIYLLGGRKVSLSYPAPITLIFGYLSWMAITAFWGENTSSALIDIFTLIGSLFAFHVLAQYFKDANFISIFLKMFALILALLCVIASIEALNMTSTINSHKNVNIFAVGSGPNVFGRNMAILCTWAICALQYKKKSLLLYLSMGFPFTLVLLSGSRGALAELIIGIILSLTLLRIPLKHKALTLPALLAPILLSAWLSPEGSLFKNIKTIQEHRLVNHTLENFHSSGREKILGKALDEGLKNPLVGNGLNSFTMEFESEWGANSGNNKIVNIHYPHNLFAEAFAEGGIIGFLILSSAAILLARNMLRRLQKTWGLMSAGVVISFVFSNLSGDIYDCRILFLFAFAWVLYYNKEPYGIYPRT